jgi:predicted HTH transcriptional regulator
LAVAMSNSGGGYIIIGVSETPMAGKFKFYESRDSIAIIEKCIYDYTIDICYKIHPVEIEGVSIVIVEVIPS